MLTDLLEDARAALWTVWDRRWLALGVTWAVCLLGWLAVALIPNSYQSQARIFVQLDDVLAQQIGIGAGSRAKDIDRVRQTLTSAVNMERVVRATRIGDTVTTPAQMEAAVAGLAKDISVVAQGANLFEITAVSRRGDLSDAENARLAQDVAQRVIDIFREENLGGARGEMRETLEFLDQQLATRQRELEEAEQRRLNFEAANPELIGGPQAIAAQLSATRAELRSVEADLAAARSALAAIDGQLAGTPRTLPDVNSGGPQAALMQAEANLAAMRGRGLTDSHPDMIALTRQIANLREQGQAQGGRGGTINPAYASLQSMRVERQASVQALQSRAAALQSETSSISASQAQEPGAAAEAQRISRDYDVLRQQYDKLLQDREELRLRGQVETERNAIKFEVVDPPTTPRSPASPNRPLLLAAVLLLGLGAGPAAGFALGQLNGGFATANRLERKLDLPVIGTISHNLTEAGRALRRRQVTLLAGGTGALCLLFVVLLGAEFIQRGMVA